MDEWMDNTWFWFTNGTPGGEVLCGYMKSSSDFSVSFWRSDSASFLSAAPHLHWLHENSPLITDKTAWLPDPGSSKTYPAYSPVTYIKVDIRKATKKRPKNLMWSNWNTFVVIQWLCVCPQGNVFFPLPVQQELCSEPCFSFAFTSRKVKNKFTLNHVRLYWELFVCLVFAFWYNIF